MLRIGVVGAGAHSRRSHGSALKAYERLHPGQIELAAVCDLAVQKARAYAEACGFGAAYPSLEAMLGSERLDGLLVISPIALTQELVAEAIPLGVPLVVEKPPGATTRQAENLLRLARRHGTPHMVSFNRRFSPAVSLAARWLATAGRGRRPRLVHARMLRVGRREAGFALGTGIHAVDLVLAFLGRPTGVRARCLRTRWPGRFQFQATVEFAGGAVGALTIAPDAGWHEESYEIIGDGYCVQVDAANCGLSVYDRGQRALHWRAPAGWPAWFRDGTVGESAAFMRAIRGVEPFGPDLEEALLSMRVAEAVQAGGELKIAPASAKS